jgi:hypothetical protein
LQFRYAAAAFRKQALEGDAGSGGTAVDVPGSRSSAQGLGDLAEHHDRYLEEEIG